MGRSAAEVQGIVSDDAFTILEPDGVTVRTVLAAQNDNFMRQMLSSRIKCRNLSRF